MPENLRKAEEVSIIEPLNKIIQNFLRDNKNPSNEELSRIIANYIGEQPVSYDFSIDIKDGKVIVIVAPQSDYVPQAVGIAHQSLPR